MKRKQSYISYGISGPIYCTDLYLNVVPGFQQRDGLKTKRKSWTQGSIRTRRVQQMYLEGRQEDKIFRTDGNASWKTSETWTVGPRKTPRPPPWKPIYVRMLIAPARWFKNVRSYLHWLILQVNVTGSKFLYAMNNASCNQIIKLFLGLKPTVRNYNRKTFHFQERVSNSAYNLANSCT